jgi:type IV pilus assembly protein PilN
LPEWLAHWREQLETMKISYNLATRPYVDIRPALKRLRVTMVVLAVIAVSLTLGLHILHRHAAVAGERNRLLESQIARVARERQVYQEMMRQPDNAELTQRIREVNRLFDDKAFSWTLAMEDLETVLPAGVHTTALEPVRAKDGSITLRLRVVGPRDRAVDLVRNLESSRRFLLPRIVGENAESSGAAGEKLEPVSASNHVNFDLLADYNSASPSASGNPEEKSEPNADKTEKLDSARQGDKISFQADRKQTPIAGQALLSRLSPIHKPNSSPGRNAGGPR